MRQRYNYCCIRCCKSIKSGNEKEDVQLICDDCRLRELGELRKLQGRKLVIDEKTKKKKYQKRNENW